MRKMLATLNGATAAAVDEARGLIWVAEAGGAIRKVPMSGGGSVALTLPAAGIAVHKDMLLIAGADGSLSTLDLKGLSSRPKALKRLDGQLGQAALTGSAVPTAALVTREAVAIGMRPRTSLTLLGTGDQSVRSVAIGGLTGVAASGKSVFVARNAGTPLRGELGMLKGLEMRSLATGLPTAGRLGLAEGGDLLLVAHPGAGRLSSLRPATGAVQTVSLSGIPGDIVEAHGLASGRIAVLTTARLVLVDQLAALAQDPTIAPIHDPIFVGSWTELGFDLGASGLSPDEVHFVVPAGLDVGFVSYARPEGSSRPVPLLVVGGKTGVHEVRLVKNAGNTVLATAPFEITDHWRDSDTGPPGFYATNSRFGGDSGWGGGPGTPQNMSTKPHSGTWHSLILMVDTDTDRWPTDAATMGDNRDAILGHVSTGVEFDGDTRSARIYYEENSQFVENSRGLTIGVRNDSVFGPVNLPNAWTDYFDQDDKGKWWSKGATLQTIISSAISDGIATTADFTDLDVLIVVIRSPDAAPADGDRFVWPHAHPAEEFLCGTNAMEDRRSFAWTYVPLDFDVHDGRQMHTTLSHELGHTLGLPDLYSFDSYSQAVKDRVTGGWDMMGGSKNRLPHYTISNKMRMGWIPPAHLKLYNFQGSNAAAENVTLHAAELGDPPAGRFKAIEIRLGDGWNYYVEYRAEQPDQVSDNLITDQTVVITDVTSDSFVAPIARPPILFVVSDADGDGPLIQDGADFEERDPGTQLDLKIEVVSTADDNAVVNVSYGANGRPEPGIRPWQGDPNWQSPDIEVRNDRADADPGTYFNVPWLGHENKIIAKIKNSGDLLAKGVVVDFFVTEYTSGDGPLVPLGSDSRDVGPGATIEFSCPWNPSSDEGRHYCVIVRLPLYKDPGNPAVTEQNIFDNEARSNYTQFISASASPSTRVGASVLLANPFKHSTLVFANVKKTHPQHRVFIDHQWLRVPGLGQRPIRVWDEAMLGTPEWDLVATKDEKRRPTMLWKVPNRLGVSGWARRPFDADCGARTLTGGVGLRIDAGRATRTQLREAKRGQVSGLVSFVDNNSPVTSGGTVLVEARTKQGKTFTTKAKLKPDSFFTCKLKALSGDPVVLVVAHYLGSTGAAASSSAPAAVAS